MVLEVREKLGMTQLEFSHFVGMTRRQIVNLEKGHSKITEPLYLLMLYIERFGVKNIQKKVRRNAS